MGDMETPIVAIGTGADFLRHHGISWDSPDPGPPDDFLHSTRYTYLASHPAC